MSNTFEEIKMEDALAHYGTKGMKWGVWNDETRRKYLGGKITNKIREKYQAKKDEKARAVEAEKLSQEEAAAKQAERAAKEKEVMDKYGVPLERYEALRKVALQSNDPRVVAKGMQFLTDEELNAKLTRMEKEAQVKKLDSSNRKNASEARRAELEARQKTIPYRIGKLAVESVRDNYVNPIIKEGKDATVKAVRRTVDKAAKSVDRQVKEQIDAKTGKKKSPVSEVKEAAKAVPESVASVKTEVAVAKETRRSRKQQESSEKKPASTRKQTIAKNYQESGKNLVASLKKNGSENDENK